MMKEVSTRTDTLLASLLSMIQGIDSGGCQTCITQFFWQVARNVMDRLGSNRSHFAQVLNELNLHGPGAELGVFKGKFAEDMVNVWVNERCDANSMKVVKINHAASICTCFL